MRDTGLDSPPRPRRLLLHVWTVRDSWAWMWVDLVIRILPMLALPLAWLTWRHQGLGWLSLPDVSFAQLARWTALGLLHGLVVATACLAYRLRWLKVRGLLSPGALAADSAYYLLINAPVEEYLFRGWLQPVAGGVLGNAWAGMAVVALIFGLYHRLGRWSWGLVGLVTAGGFYFGTIQLLHGSLVVTILAHTMADWALLSFGPQLLVSHVPRWACDWRDAQAIEAAPGRDGHVVAGLSASPATERA